MTALHQYLTDNDLNLSQLAQRMNRAVSTLSRPIRGERDVTMRIAEEVQTATEGDVSAEDFVRDCLAARRAVLARSLAAAAETEAA